MNQHGDDDMKPGDTRRWQFFRAGGFDQVRLDHGADLLALKALDPKLWVALSVPVKNIEFPAATLACLDTDHDGQIRIPELLAAIDWCAERLKGIELLLAGPAKLPLSAIDEQTEAGRRILASARRMLSNLGADDASAIDAEVFADPARIFCQTAFNGDGIITALSTTDLTLQAAIQCCGEVLGTRTDRCGLAGVDGEALQHWFELLHRQRAWRQACPGLGIDGEIVDDGGGITDLLALAARAELLLRLSGKIDDYFTRCRLLAYDPRAAAFVNSSDGELDAIGRSALAVAPAALAELPLARVEAGRPLPLADGINPAWAGELVALREQIIEPLLGRPLTALDEAGWRQVQRRTQALLDWLAARPAMPDGMPDPATLDQWSAENVESRLRQLLADDLALADESAGIDEVRQLVLYGRDLARFASNFVNFRQFYTRQEPAIFQSGTLYLDGRSCELVVAVDDVGKHAALATLAKLYLVYCECRRGEQKRLIAAAMTDGDSDQLMVGRNGVFIDRAGQDWDATIVRLIEHPISLRQAFWAPWRRLSRMINEQLQKLAASKDQAVDKKAGASLAEPLAKPAVAANAKTPAAPFDVAKFAGVFAAIGLAIGAIGTVAASAVAGFISLRWWQMPLAMAGVVLMVSGPSVVLAWFKLRHRTLGPLLDANGWAINARAAINLPFGKSLTQLARLPADAEQALLDPYAEKPTPWPIYLVLLVLLGAALYFLVNLSSRTGSGTY